MITLLIILFSLLLGGCQLFTAPELMERAERQMAEHPDSALATMRSVKKYAVLLPERRAKYGLLYTTALRKNRINIDSDSLIRFSTEYYDVHGTAEERMHSYYELGRVQQHAGENLAATLSYLDAAQYTDVVDDNYLKGLLYTNLSEVYVFHCRHLTALEMAKKSYDYYKAARIEKYQAYQLYDMGRICYYMRQYEQSLQYLLSALEESKRIGFDGLHSVIIKELGIVYNAVKDYDNSYKYFVLSEKAAGDKAYNYADICGAAANTFAYKGFRSKANVLLRRGWELAGDLGDSVAMRYYHSNYLSIIGESKQSSKQHEYAMHEHLVMLSQYVESPMKDVQSDYFKKKALQKATLVAKRKNTYIISIVFCCVLLVAFVIYYRRRVQQREKDLVAQIETNLATIEDVKMNFDRYNQTMSAKIYNLAGKQFEIFDELCFAYYEQSDNNKRKSYIHNRLQQLIYSFSQESDTLTKLEDIINEYRDNAMQKLRNEITDLKEDDYRFICYVFAGFSNQTIAVFCKSQAGAVASRKHRLKNKISNTKTENTALFIKLFSASN